MEHKRPAGPLECKKFAGPMHVGPGARDRVIESMARPHPLAGTRISEAEIKRMAGTSSRPVPGKPTADEVAFYKSICRVEYKEIAAYHVPSAATGFVKAAVSLLASELGVPEPTVRYFDDRDFIDDADRAAGAEVGSHWAGPGAVGTYNNLTNEIWLKYTLSSDLEGLARTVVHEMAHAWQHKAYGPDLDDRHKAERERQATESEDRGLAVLGYPWGLDQ